MSANKPEEKSALVDPLTKQQSTKKSDGDYTLGQFLKEHRLLFIITLLLTASAFIAYVLNFHGGISNENGDWGTFGDFIGGTLNPIFGFISVILLFYAVTLQKKELKETKEALQSQSNSAKITTEIQLLNAIQDFLANEIKHQESSQIQAEAELDTVAKSQKLTIENISSLEEQKATLENNLITLENELKSPRPNYKASFFPSDMAEELHRDDNKVIEAQRKRLMQLPEDIKIIEQQIASERERFKDLKIIKQ